MFKLNKVMTHEQVDGNELFEFGSCYKTYYINTCVSNKRQTNVM